MAEPYYPFNPDEFLWSRPDDDESGTVDPVFNPYNIGYVGQSHVDPTRPHENLEWRQEGGQWKLSLPEEYRRYPKRQNPIGDIDLPPGYTIELEYEYDEDGQESGANWVPKFTGEGSEIIPTYQDPTTPGDGGGGDDGDDDFDWVVAPPTPPVTPPVTPSLPPWAGSAGYESQFNVPAQNVISPPSSSNALPWAQSTGYEPGPQVPAQNVIIPDEEEARVVEGNVAYPQVPGGSMENLQRFVQAGGDWTGAFGGNFYDPKPDEGTREGKTVHPTVPGGSMENLQRTAQNEGLPFFGGGTDTRFFMANGGLATLPAMRRAAPWKWRSRYSRR